MGVSTCAVCVAVGPFYSVFQPRLIKLVAELDHFIMLIFEDLIFRERVLRS